MRQWLHHTESKMLAWIPDGILAKKVRLKSGSFALAWMRLRYAKRETGRQTSGGRRQFRYHPLHGRKVAPALPKAAPRNHCFF